MRWLWLLIAVPALIAFPLDAAADNPGLSVAGVQLYIDTSMYKSIESFSHAIKEELNIAVSTTGNEISPDLIIFPEYTSVFLALIPYAPQIAASDTMAEALASIRNIHPMVKSLRDLFAEQAGWVESEMDRIWGGLAKEYGAAILSGTYFAVESGSLRNRLVVYDEEGRRLHEQDKVYLTEFELDVIGLEPGALGSAALFEIDGNLIASTICRDTFFPAWDRVLAGADYWIDIKANGEEFTEEIAGRFFSALPERIEDSGADGGMTVCLTGSFLDLFWEGRSFIVSRNGGKANVGGVAVTYSYGALVRDIVKSRIPIER
jgi:predicted amidohydrolase